MGSEDSDNLSAKNEADRQVERLIKDHPSSPERQSFLELTRSLATLPFDQATAALETSAAIGSVSLRAGIEFLRDTPAAAEILRPGELRSWGEMGRRLALGDYDAAVSFFAAGVEPLRNLPVQVQSSIFELSLRQLLLSTLIGLRTFSKLPKVFHEVADVSLFQSALEIAIEVSRRSAKHSAEFVDGTPEMSRTLKEFASSRVTEGALNLAMAFAARAGGIAADAWTSLPAALAQLSVENALRLMNSVQSFLERGGGAALHILLTGGEILRRAPEIFDDWLELLWVVAQNSNASLVAFVRSSSSVFRLVSDDVERQEAIALTKRVLSLTKEIAATDPESALACFRSSARALRSVSIEQFEAWARRGLSSNRVESRARRSYFSLETRGSFEALKVAPLD